MSTSAAATTFTLRTPLQQSRTHQSKQRSTNSPTIEEDTIPDPNHAIDLDDPIATANAVHKTAQFLVNNIFTFQGCDKGDHGRALREVRDKHIRDDGNPIISIRKLVAAFSRKISFPEALIPAGDWMNPLHPNVPQPDQLESICCGVFPEYLDHDGQSSSSDTVHTSKVPATLSLLGSEPLRFPPEVELSVQFDIDSILALPSSLAIASQGLTINLCPSYMQNIRSDLHIKLPLPPSISSTRSASICDIPHFQLGSLVGPLNIAIYILLPALYERGRSSNFPTQDQLARFFNKLFLPAVYDNATADYLQHLPASYEDARSKALASGMERLSAFDPYQPHARLQLLRYHLPNKLLHDVWDSVLARTLLPGNHDFDGIQIFLNAKNMKTESKRPTPQSCFTDFLILWAQCCCGNYLHPRTTWIDYGKETVYPVAQMHRADDTTEHWDHPQVHLWRKCCLKKLVERAQAHAEVEKGFKVTHYYFAQTEEVGTMTMIPNKSNIFHRGGLVYSQYYSSIKEMFDAAKTYPFDNPALEALAVDPYLTKAIQATGRGGRRIDLGKLQQGYLSSRDRALAALRTNAGKSYGVREEHRVTLDLLESIATMLESPTARAKADQPTYPRRNNPFFSLRTVDITRFMEYNILRYVVPFEMIARSSDRNGVPWESTKMMVMLLRALRSTLKASLLQNESALWKSESVQQNNQRRHIGMGLCDSLKKYGIGWLSVGLVDWNTLTFRPTVAEHVMFNDNRLFESYKARWKHVRNIKDSILEVDQLAEILKRAAAKKSIIAMNCILDHINSLCIRSYRQEIWDVLKDMMIFYDDDDRVQCLDGDVPLCHTSIKRRRNPEKFAWYFPARSKRSCTTIDFVKLIWFYNDGLHRTWKNKPYRLLFEHCDRVIGNSAGNRWADEWKSKFPAVFLRYNYTFPRPNNQRFLPRETKPEGRLLSFYTAIHRQVENGIEWEAVDWSDPGMWSPGNGDKYMTIGVQKLVSFTVAETINRVQSQLGEPNRRHVLKKTPTPVMQEAVHSVADAMRVANVDVILNRPSKRQFEKPASIPGSDPFERDPKAGRLEADGANNDQWEIEQILDSCDAYQDGNFDFLVRWKGWGPEYDEWIPGEDMSAAAELVHDFKMRNKHYFGLGENQKSPKRARRC